MFLEQDPWQWHEMKVSSSLVATGLLVYSGKNIRLSLSHCQMNGVSVKSGSRSIHARHCWNTRRPCWKGVFSVVGRHSGLIFETCTACCRCRPIYNAHQTHSHSSIQSMLVFGSKKAWAIISLISLLEQKSLRMLPFPLPNRLLTKNARGYTLYSRVYQNLAISSENYRTFPKFGPYYKEKACKFLARSDYSLRSNSCVLFEIFVARRKIRTAQ